MSDEDGSKKTQETISAKTRLEQKLVVAKGKSKRIMMSMDVKKDKKDKK